MCTHLECLCELDDVGTSGIELQVVTSCPAWELGTELSSSGDALNR